MVEPPSSRALSAAVRSPLTKVSRPSASRSAPTTAASVEPDAAEGGLERGHRADPGDARGRGEIGRGPARRMPIGRIDVAITSPGTTPAIHAVAARRASWATPPRATIIARPTVSAPTVSVVRLRSRTSEPRVSRTAPGATNRNGIAASGPSGPSRNGVSSVATRRMP